MVALHEAAKSKGYFPLLEVSTKSEVVLGQRLSAFNLKAKSDMIGEIPLECAFQGSKVFENGGPYTDPLFVGFYARTTPEGWHGSMRITTEPAQFKFNDFTFSQTGQDGIL